MNKIIAVDCDDVLCNTVEAILHYTNGKFHGKAITRDQVTHFHWHTIAGYETDSKNFDNLMIDFFSEESLVTTIPVVSGALEGLFFLKSLGYRIQLITGRREKDRKYTESRLETHLPDLIDDLHFASHGSAFHVGKNKADLMKHIGAELLIDDGLHNCNNLAQVGIKSLLLDTPWNQTKILAREVKRVKSRDEIITYFKYLQDAR